MTSAELFTCQCCGYKTLKSGGGCFEICAVCGWQDDPSLNDDPDLRICASGESLRQAQHSYLCDAVPEDEYQKDPHWKLLDPPKWEPPELSDPDFVVDSCGVVKKFED